MKILIVDDSKTIRLIIKSYLTEAGYSNLLFAESAQDTFEKLGINPVREQSGGAGLDIDLILLDIVLPDMDGREACRIIKSVERLQDIPVIMVTSLTESEHLEKAFAAGAIDYITKPINKIELLARSRSALKLKHEMDSRKMREQKLLEVTRQLEVAVQKLNLLSSLDGLTGIANRRRFDEYMETEWKRGRRHFKPLSLIMADIDFFKAYNDTYGHQAGDECLKTVANTIQSTLRRPEDLLCRYGGEEFAVVLPGTHKNGAVYMANTICSAVEKMGILHSGSKVSDHVTVSLGVATILPTKELSPADLISAADGALYRAKSEGRNQIAIASINFNI